ncbi:choice-of-anchor L domain-containing protein [Lacinutrix iliipiscaria]|uniref:Choice-of-anchor L domain-containing protein n=1 Tax=Lacinutrix iliipiscaria TaxID=1230532 RepID=A0ABW5WPQ2_9FLAO
MKSYLVLFIFLYSSLLFSQNIQVDSNIYTPQQLIEDILIDSDCISNVVVTNIIGGDFGGSDQSYGYFDATGTTFPIQSGLVLSTGRLSNVPGPNTSLSDDDAAGWSGDSDLETVLGESNTHNATILEFNFESISEQISFRYLFASEEYQEGNSNTCNYSDLFGFLIRPEGTSTYTNIALVPGTTTPVKVTTVHPGISGSCNAINEEYFGSFNNASAPINFNGQTTVLTASTTVIPNQTYHVKLVIADEQNYRYDSAVFLEADSFLPNIHLGNHRLFATNNPLCENETLELDITQSGAIAYTWFKNGVPIIGETNPTYTIVDAGVYSAEVAYSASCIASGELIVEYSPNPIVNNTTLISCDIDQDGMTLYNLFDAEQEIITSGIEIVTDFYYTSIDAEQDIDAIPNATTFENSSVMQTVFARVENEYGCFSVAEVLLDISNNDVSIPPFSTCDDFPVDGYSSFDLNQLRINIESIVPPGLTIRFYPTESDLLSETNQIDGNYTNSIQGSETIYVLITEGSNCYAVSTVILTIDETPILLEDETINYCVNTYPQTITLESDIINGLPEDFTYEWLLDGVPTLYTDASININETGTYTVIVTHPNGCNATRNITVEVSDLAIITDVAVEGVAPNNTITITVPETSEYEFMLDHGLYQNSNVFTNVSAGEHIVFVRDKDGCGVVQEIINVLGFPSYFTPNGDHFHDTWKPIGVDARFRNTMTIQIFNRYGKLIKQVNPQGQGWNGTLNGKNLSADDYWYVVTFSNGKTYRGHFSLVR